MTLPKLETEPFSWSTHCPDLPRNSRPIRRSGRTSSEDAPAKLWASRILASVRLHLFISRSNAVASVTGADTDFNVNARLLKPIDSVVFQLARAQDFSGGFNLPVLVGLERSPRTLAGLRRSGETHEPIFPEVGRTERLRRSLDINHANDLLDWQPKTDLAHRFAVTATRNHCLAESHSVLEH